MSDSLLELRHFSKCFDGKKALDDISFKAFNGQIVGIAGPRESGKSTLLNIICKSPFGPCKGELFFEGNSIGGLPAHKIASLGIVKVLRRENIFTSLSAVNNVLIAIESAPITLNLEEREALAENALKVVKFPKALYDIPASALNIFHQKQLMLANAIAMKPKLLMIDMPTAELTVAETLQMADIMLAIRDTGVCMLIIEHALGMLLKISDQMLIINQGKLIASGTPKDVISSPKILEAYLEAVA